MADNLHTELAARMPWLHAQPDSMWEASGKNPSGGTFSNCLARALPPFVTGSDTPVFEVLIYAQLGYFVPASAITTARELLLVEAGDPTSAYFVRDQESIDRAPTPGVETLRNENIRLRNENAMLKQTRVDVNLLAGGSDK